MKSRSPLSPELWARLSEVVLAAKDLAEGPRAQLLAEASASDPELRAYLDTFLRAADELDEAEIFQGPSLESRRLSVDASTIDLEGAQLGGYRLGPCIGRGGMGEVYLARRVDGELDRQVAVKVLRSGVDRRGEALFAEERNILAALEHSSIARLYDAGHSAEGLPFLVMEYVQGQPIDEFCRLQNATLADRVELMARVCRGVHFAHRSLVLHSDLKPANILVQKDGQPVLLDFGISRWLGHGSETDDFEDTRNAPSVNGFTPAFASPEQLKPELLGNRSLGVASDIYSLGRILQVLTDAVEDSGKLVRRDLAAVIEYATRVDPDQRYGSAEQLADDLERLLAVRPVVAIEPTFGYVVRRFVTRHRIGAGLATLTLLWVVGTLLVMASQHSRIAQQRDEARDLALKADQERQAVLRLADVKRLRDLEAEAETLWPIHPDRADAMRRWLSSARELSERRSVHAAALREMSGRLETEADPMDGSDQDIAAQMAWQQGILETLVSGLGSWQDPERGLIADISRRFELADAVGRRSIEAQHDQWRQTLSELQDAERSLRYRDLELAPQIGLVPLGPDPDSSLLEFAVLDTGSVPVRDVESRQLRLQDDFAVVLVLIPGGRFVMGSQEADPEGRNYDAEASFGRDFPQPPQDVEMAPFFLSKYELTQAQWAAITGGDWPSRHSPRESPAVEESATGRNPVEQVSWKMADQWLRRWNLRLPTEAQWEYAARAGTSTPWWTGADVGSLAEAANIADRHLRDHGGNPEWSYTVELEDGYGLHAPVGRLRANAFGLHDIHGNVWEWCAGSPELSSSYGSEPTLRAARGGSWWYSGSFAKVTHRIYGTETSAISDLGIRAARPLTVSGTSPRTR